MLDRASAKTAPPAADSTVIQAISDWLIGRGLLASDFSETMTGFCERLVAAGIPLRRGMMGMRTLHPTVDAITYVWRPGEGTAGEDHGLDRLDTPGWKQSPVNHMISSGEHVLRRKLVGPGARLDFPILDELRAEGATDYYARMVPFDLGPERQLDAGMVSTWVTNEPDGFTDGHIATLDRLIPRLALSVNANLVKQIAVNVLDTYVGPDAGRRIMGGEIHRSAMRTIRAVLLNADLRGFTALADVMPGTEMVDLLYGYFDRMVMPIVERGGQVLKFLGDGVLATFDLEDQPRDAVCSKALSAAGEILRQTAALNEELSRNGTPVMSLDIALHLGDVFYGNIGAADRLDFTVIGPAVNEVSRIEALCAPLDRNVLVSEAFAAAASACTDALVPLGRHRLRGVREPQAIYGVRSVPA